MLSNGLFVCSGGRKPRGIQNSSCTRPNAFELSVFLLFSEDADVEDEEEEDSYLDKFLKVIGFPFQMLWKLTVPLLDANKWNRV